MLGTGVEGVVPELLVTLGEGLDAILGGAGLPTRSIIGCTLCNGSNRTYGSCSPYGSLLIDVSRYGSGSFFDRFRDLGSLRLSPDCIAVLADGLIGMLSIPLTDLLKISATVGAASLLHAEAMNGKRGSGQNGDTASDSSRLECDAADTKVAMTLVERRVDLYPILARIIGICLTAPDARRTSLHAPRATMVPKRHAAVGIGLRTAATHSIKAIALRLFFGTELANEFAVLEMTATLAVVMDGLAEDLLRLAIGGELRNLAHQQYVDKNGDEMLGVARASGDIHDGSNDTVLLQELRYTESVGGIRLCTHPTAVNRARTERDDILGILRSFKKMLGAWLVCNTQCLPAPLLEDGALIH